MIWILKIYQRANNIHDCLQICAERCVSNLQRDAFIQKGQGVLWMLDKTQEGFFSYYFSFIKKMCKKCQQYLSNLCLLPACLLNYFPSIFITSDKYSMTQNSYNDTTSLHKHTYPSTYLPCFQKDVVFLVVLWVIWAHPVTPYYVSGPMTIVNVYFCIHVAWLCASSGKHWPRWSGWTDEICLHR